MPPRAGRAPSPSPSRPCSTWCRTAPGPARAAEGVGCRDYTIIFNAHLVGRVTGGMAGFQPVVSDRKGLTEAGRIDPRQGQVPERAATVMNPVRPSTSQDAPPTGDPAKGI